MLLIAHIIEKAYINAFCVLPVNNKEEEKKRDIVA